MVGTIAAFYQPKDPQCTLNYSHSATAALLKDTTAVTDGAGNQSDNPPVKEKPDIWINCG